MMDWCARSQGALPSCRSHLLPATYACDAISLSIASSLSIARTRTSNTGSATAAAAAAARANLIQFSPTLNA